MFVLMLACSFANILVAKSSRAKMLSFCALSFMALTTCCCLLVRSKSEVDLRLRAYFSAVSPFIRYWPGLNVTFV